MFTQIQLQYTTLPTVAGDAGLPVGNPISIIAMEQTLQRMERELHETAEALHVARLEEASWLETGHGLDTTERWVYDATLNKVRQEVMRLQEVGGHLRDGMWGIRKTLEAAEEIQGRKQFEATGNKYGSFWDTTGADGGQDSD